MTDIIGIDIGGSHITSALVNGSSYSIKENSFERNKIDSSGAADAILNGWLANIKNTLQKCSSRPDKIAFAMPGPFDYEKGISLIKNLHKYDSLYGKDLKSFLSSELGFKPENIRFRNDAEAFLAGEIEISNYNSHSSTLGITLGTGLGSALSQNGIVRDANFAVTPFMNGIAEEYLSTRWFTSTFSKVSGKTIRDVKNMLSQEDCQDIISGIFEEFTQNLTSFLTSVIIKENTETIIIGGNIARASDRFLEKLSSNLSRVNPGLRIHLAGSGEVSAIVGASLLFQPSQTNN